MRGSVSIIAVYWPVEVRSPFLHIWTYAIQQVSFDHVRFDDLHNEILALMEMSYNADAMLKLFCDFIRAFLSLP